MLAVFEEVWLAHKHSSKHPKCQEPSSMLSAPVSASSSSASCGSGQSVPAAGPSRLTPSGSSPSSQSQACSRSLSRHPSPAKRVAPARSPSVLTPPCHQSQSWSLHPFTGRWSPATRLPTWSALFAWFCLACMSSTRYGLACSSPDRSCADSRYSLPPSLRHSHDCSSSRPRSSGPSLSHSSSTFGESASALGDYKSPLDFVPSQFASSLHSSDCRQSPVAGSCRRSWSPVPQHRHSLSLSWSCLHCSSSLVAGSSHLRSDRSLSTRSQGSRSPSWGSSRCGLGSPGSSCRRSHSWSHSPSHQVDEHHQKEHSSLELIHVIDKMLSVSSLMEAPSEGRKILSFCKGRDDEEQPASSYMLPIGDASVDILANIDDHISSTAARMQSKKISKLILYPGVHSCRFYSLEGEEVVKFQFINRHMTELAGMRFFNNLALAKTDVVLSSSEAEDLEAAVRSIVEVTSWMDWWTFTKSISLQSSQEVRMLKRLFVAVARCQLLVEKTASPVWANLVLNR